jgi:hypothetical protein
VLSHGSKLFDLVVVLAGLKRFVCQPAFFIGQNQETLLADKLRVLADLIL